MEIEKTKTKDEKNPKENIDNDSDSPIILTPIEFTGELDTNDSADENTKTPKDLPSIKDKKLYDQSSFIYDKYSKRLIYFNVPKKTILIYNRTKTKLIKKLHVFFNYKVLNACADKQLKHLLIFANPMVNNKFIFIYSIEKETFVYQLKDDFSHFLSFFFVEKNTFVLVFVNKIILYSINMDNDEVKIIKTLDYNKGFISNFFFVRQYLTLLIYRDDNYFDMYSLRKNEIELLKTFNKVFNTMNVMFKSNSKGGFFSNLFSSKADKNTRLLQLAQNFNNAYGNRYKSSQFFFEYIYSNIFFILLSYEDNAIFMMKIKNINKFPKEEDGNFIIKLEYKNHSNNSTIQVLDNLLFVHNFSTDTTIIYDIALKAKEKSIGYSKNILKIFHGESFFKLDIIGGNLEETRKKKDAKGQQELEKKLYSLNLNLENLFKNNQDIKNKQKLNNEVELDGMLMIARRNKSKQFFLGLFHKMLLDKTTENRTESIQLILNEFSRQIKKSTSLASVLMSNISQLNESINASKAVKLSYKRDNEKFYLDDKYIMLSTKNTLSQYEVIKSFKEIAQLGKDKKINMDTESVFEFLFYNLFFFVQLVQNKIPIISLYYDTILILIQQIKDEKNIIKLITYHSYERYFPLGSIDVAKYLLDNYSHPIIKVEAYKILKILKAHNELFYYLIKNEGIDNAIKFLYNSFDESNFNDVKKSLVEYLNKCQDNDENKLFIEEIVNDDEDY